VLAGRANGRQAKASEGLAVGEREEE